MERGDFAINKLLGVILAVFGILIFIFVLFKLYSINLNQEDENVRRALELIAGRAENLNNEESVEMTVQGFKDFEDWYLVGFDARDVSAARPQKCFFDNCVCLCKEANALGCQQSGVCQKIAENVSVSASVASVEINYEYASEGGLQVLAGLSYLQENKRIACIPMFSSLGEIRVRKNSGVVEFYSAQDREVSLGAMEVFRVARTVEGKNSRCLFARDSDVVLA